MVIRLEPYEEAVGILVGYSEEGTNLVVHLFSPNTNEEIILEFNRFESKLLIKRLTEEMIGETIGIIKTDIPRYPVILRGID